MSHNQLRLPTERAFKQAAFIYAKRLSVVLLFVCLAIVINTVYFSLSTNNLEHKLSDILIKLILFIVTMFVLIISRLMRFISILRSNSSKLQDELFDKEKAD